MGNTSRQSKFTHGPDVALDSLRDVVQGVEGRFVGLVQGVHEFELCRGGPSQGSFWLRKDRQSQGCDDVRQKARPSVKTGGQNQTPRRLAISFPWRPCGRTPRTQVTPRRGGHGQLSEHLVQGINRFFIPIKWLRVHLWIFIVDFIPSGRYGVKRNPKV